MLFDTHTHLNDEQYDADCEEVIQRAYKGGVAKMLIASYDDSSIREAICISSRKDFLYCSVGIHPHHASQFTKLTQEDIKLQIRLHSNKIVAIGEIGLDFHYLLASAETQKSVFQQQILIAAEYGLPIIVHNRKASDDCMAIISKHFKEGSLSNPPGVFHHFSGDLHMAIRLIEMGFYLSFAGPVTFKNAKRALEVIPNIPLDRILIETDCPYLTPEPFRGRRNEPLYVRYIAQKIADLLDKPVEMIEDITTQNACRCFSIKTEG
jgi:TatD DNase family protein